MIATGANIVESALLLKDAKVSRHQNLLSFVQAVIFSGSLSII
jgi:hypothetical protein